MRQFLTATACFLVTLAMYPHTKIEAAESQTPVPSATSGAAIADPAKQGQPVGHHKEISVFSLSRDGRFALTGDDQENNYLWDVKSGKLIREVGTPDPVRIWVVASAFSPDSSTLVWSRFRKQTPVVWDVKSGKKLAVLKSSENGHKSDVIALAYSDDGQYIASGDMHGVVVVWSFKERSVVRRYKAHEGEVSQIVFIPGSREFATAGMDGAIYLWSPARDQALASLLKPSNDIVTSLSVSPDGNVLYAASGSQTTVRSWNVQRRTQRSTISFNDRLINNIAVSPDGKYLAVVEEDQSLMLWNMRESKPDWKVDLPDSALNASFSPDGKSLYTSGGDNWVREWDVTSGRLIRKFAGAVD